MKRVSQLSLDPFALHGIAGKILVLFVLLTVPASAGETICRRAAASLRIGDVAPSTLFSGLAGVVAAKEEGDNAAAVLRTRRADPALLHAIEDVTGGGQVTSRVQWLRQGEFGAVEVVAGTAYCQTLLFFRVLDGRAVGMPAPKELNTDQACWGDSVWLGTIGGIAYAIEQNDRFGDRGRSMTASAWTGMGWNRACSLTETHAITLAVNGRYCRPGSDCTALETLALRRAKQAQLQHERVTPAVGLAKQGDAAGQIDTGKTALPQEIPTFGASTASNFTGFTRQQVFQASYQGQPIVGAIGAGHWGWRDYDGWLVGFWQPGKDGYEPLAGFQISRRLGVIRSLDVQAP